MSIFKRKDQQLDQRIRLQQGDRSIRITILYFLKSLGKENLKKSPRYQDLVAIETQQNDILSQSHLNKPGKISNNFLCLAFPRTTYGVQSKYENEVWSNLYYLLEFLPYFDNLSLVTMATITGSSTMLLSKCWPSFNT